jgi:5-methylcytosine-specific restriction endonuclease McrA
MRHETDDRYGVPEYMLHVEELQRQLDALPQEVKQDRAGTQRLFMPRSRQIISLSALREQYQILEQFGGRCAYCQAAQATTWDHVIPASQGGKMNLENLVPACNLCNSEKRDQDVLVWLASRGIEPGPALLAAIEQARVAATQVIEGGASNDYQ